jgi:hypothetical protein
LRERAYSSTSKDKYANGRQRRERPPGGEEGRVHNITLPYEFT